MKCFIAEGICFEGCLVPFHCPAMILQSIVDFAAQKAEGRVVAYLLARSIAFMMILHPNSLKRWSSQVVILVTSCTLSLAACQTSRAQTVAA